MPQLTLDTVDLQDKAAIEAAMEQLKAAYVQFKPKKKMVYECPVTKVQVVAEADLVIANLTGDLAKNKLTAPVFVCIGAVTRAKKAKTEDKAVEDNAITNGNGHHQPPTATNAVDLDPENELDDEDDDDEVDDE